MSRSVVVFGATGAQGGSVVKALLQSKNYSVIGITRDAGKPASKELADQGVKVVEADLGDEKSLLKALDGAYAVFSTTNFWEAGESAEIEQAKRVAKVAKEVGVQHFLWSTLPYAGKESNGKWPVTHFDSKAKVDEFIESLGFKYLTYIVPSFYYSNFHAPFNMARKGEDGIYTFALPCKASTKLTMFDVKEDTGKPIPGILDDPERWGKGQRINYAGAHITVTEIVETFKRVTGKDARIVEVPYEDFAKQSKELADMFGWFEEYGYYGKQADIHSAEQLVPKLVSWEDFLKKTASVW
jgi:uncharacterized protein YbjT (DUF2867 family)